MFQKNLRNVRLNCQPGYCLLVGGEDISQTKIFAILETSLLQCVEHSDEFNISVTNSDD